MAIPTSTPYTTSMPYTTQTTTGGAIKATARSGVGSLKEDSEYLYAGRVGRIVVDGITVKKELEAVFDIFMRVGFYPFDIYSDANRLARVYTGQCEAFSELVDSRFIPEYPLKFKRDLVSNKIVDGTIVLQAADPLQTVLKEQEEKIKSLQDTVTNWKCRFIELERRLFMRPYSGYDAVGKSVKSTDLELLATEQSAVSKPKRFFGWKTTR